MNMWITASLFLAVFTCELHTAPTPLQEGLIAEYRLDEGSGSVAKNFACKPLAGSNNGDLSFVNSPSWVSAGLDFSGGTKYLSGSITAGQLSQVSIYCVFNWPAANGTGQTELFGAANNPACRITSHNGTVPAFNFSNGAVAAQAYGVSGGAININNVHDSNWHLLTGIYDGAYSRLFIDDTEVVTASQPNVTSIALSDLQLAALNSSNTFPGKIAYAAIYRTGHTLAQQLAQFNTIKAFMAARSVTLSNVPRVVAFDGDSITTGNSTATPYPAVLYPNLIAGTQAQTLAMNSAQIVGNSGNSLTARAPLLDEMYSVNHTKNVVCIMIGHNDLTNRSAASVVADLKTYCLARKAVGWSVVVCTITPTTVTGFGGASGNSLRNSANTLIRADTSFYDALADVAADSTVGTDAAASDATYYADGVHPTTAAHAIMAAIVQTAIESLL